MSQPVRFRSIPLRVLGVLLFLLPAVAARAQNDMVYSHSNPSRNSWNPNETLLAPSNVVPGSFGKLFNHSVDEHVYAQPLYVHGLTIGGVTHNVVFVCTMGDSVYAFDADTNQPALWHDNFTGINAGVTATTIPYGEIAMCPDSKPVYGIMDTPAIDLSTNTLYCVAATKEVSSGPVTHYVHRLHALSLTDGTEKFGGPVSITAVWNGIGGPITFNNSLEINRPGLVLTNGQVYTFWSSHCDDGAYYGWVLGYNATSLAQVSVYNISPVTQRGGIWQSGTAPALDSNGNFYMTTGTGAFDANIGGVDYGESIIKFSGGASPAIKDYFAPSDWTALDLVDDEMGATGAVLLPDTMGTAAHPHLLTCGDKAGDIFLLDRDNLGGFDQGPGNTDACLQRFDPAPMAFSAFLTPAVYNNTVFWSYVDTPIEAFTLVNGQYSTTPSSSTTNPPNFHFPGVNPSVSSNGNTNGILWAIEPDPSNVGLHAYDATNLADEIYNSNMVPADVINSPSNKFTPPTIINGKVYVATANSLEVFGLRITATPFPTPVPTGTPSPTAAASPTKTATLTPSSTPSLTPLPSLTATPTMTITFTFSTTPTNSPTQSPTGTSTPLFTDSATSTATSTPSLTPTLTPTLTPSPTASFSPTFTPSATPTNSPPPNPTGTPTPLFTDSATATASSTPSFIPTLIPSPTPTTSQAFSPTPTDFALPGHGPVVAAPNLLQPWQSTATFSVPESGASLDVSIYDVAGEKIVEGRGVPGSSLCYWNSTGSASGLYLAYVKVADPDGSTRSQILKLVVIH